MKIGVYGGSFNPVHYGHMQVVTDVLKKRIVDKVWILPCKDHAFDKKLIPLESRVNMLNYAIAELGKLQKDVSINLIESKIEGKSYSVDTLRLLKSEYDKQKYQFYFIAGVDALNDIDKWHDSKLLKKTTQFIGIKRDGYKFDRKQDLMIKDMLEEVSDMNISSTDIRERIKCNESITGMVPESVERYILKNKLYINTMKFENPGCTADLIVENNSGILFIKRKHSPFKGYWAFPGGYLENGKETIEQAAVRELFEETSLKSKTEDLELLGVYSDPKRDPRGHVVSHVYVVKKYSGKLKANDDADDAKLFKTKPEKLAFDHSKIYDDYMQSKNNKSHK